MKIRVIVIFTLVFLVIANEFSVKTVADADSGYALVACDEAEFYSDASCRMVKFCLPYGYYVRIVSVGTDYSRVIYMDGQKNLPFTEGYVSNLNLDFSMTPSTSPYPDLILTVKSEEVLFSDVTLNQPKTVISVNSHASYYGKINVNGENFLYVYCSGYVGYVRESAFYDFEITVHPDVLRLNAEKENSVEITSEDHSSGETNTVKSDTFRIVVIAVIAIAGLCLLYLILRPERQSSNDRSYFDD